jgi:hypothetical protein
MKMLLFQIIKTEQLLGVKNIKCSTKIWNVPQDALCKINAGDLTSIYNVLFS